MATDRSLQRCGDLLGGVHGRPIIRAEVQVPVPLQRERPPLERERVRGRELAHVPEGRPRQRDEAEREIVIQGRHVEAERIAPVGQEGLDLGAEEEFPRGGVEVVVQRLDPEPVPRGEQAAASRVPEREREHALEPRDARLPPFRVRAEDHLRVGGRPEPMALLLERPPQLAVVVDLSIVDDREAGALHVHRLAAGGREIDDAQPSVRHPDPRLHPESFVVGAAMTKRIDHALHAGRVRGTTVEQDYPADAAHRLDGAPSPTRARSRALTSQCPRRRSEEAACASRAPFTVRPRPLVAPV